MSSLDMIAVRDLSEAFLKNLMVLVVLAYLLNMLWARTEKMLCGRRQILSGLLFSAATVFCMQMPLEPQPGLLLDQRGLILLFAASFGGPWAALIAGAVTAAYRTYLGGIGMWAGLGAIVCTTGLSFVMAYWGRGLRDARSAAAGGFVLALVTLPWFLALGDIAAGFDLMVLYAPAYMFFYVGGSLLLSSILMLDRRRNESERKLALSEQKLRDILDVSTDWFWEVDADLRFSYLSQSFRQMFSRDPSAYIGKRRSDLATPDNLEEVLAYEEMLRRREPFVDFTYALYRADGAKRWVTICGKPIFDENGAFKGYRGSGREVTPMVTAKRELELALLTAEDANRAKSAFLSQMSHELRTPLNAIIGFADMIRTEIRGPVGHDEYKQDAQDIYDSGHHLLSLINDLLDLSKIEAGKFVLNRQEIRIGDVVQSTTRLMEQRARKAGVLMTFADHSNNAPIEGDERAIRQIVLNLTSNAIKFTPEGGAIGVAIDRLPGERVQIKVSDTGAGIAPSEQEQVFQPFEQASNTRIKAIEGTGLGLPICKGLVEAHGGDLKLESAVDQGTTVTFTLPANAIVARGVSANVCAA